MLETLAKLIYGSVLSSVGIGINNGHTCHMQVNDDRVFAEIMRRGSLGLAESYMAGDWYCDDLDDFFFRILKYRLDLLAALNPVMLKQFLHDNFGHSVTIRQAREVGKVHYDLGNDFFERMLDPETMSYTCAYWSRPDASLHQAQLDKLDLVCRKLGLRPGLRLLDIGCGWGGLAAHAAKNYGVSVVGITISGEQAELARKRCAGLPVTIRLQDYREINGPFDAIASLGMFEHVEAANHDEYFSAVNRCLAADGLFLLHTIGKEHGCDNSDPFIHNYVFPQGMVPAHRRLAKSIQNHFTILDWHALGSRHYCLTLSAWHENFRNAWPDLRQHYAGRLNGKFKPMWDFYLSACAAAFRAHRLDVFQIIMAKQPQPYSPIR